MKKIVNENILRNIIKEHVRKTLIENYFGGDYINYEAKDNDSRLSDMNNENKEDEETRDSIEEFFKQPGINCAAYAYQLYGVKPKKGDDSDEMKNARSKFAKCLNHEKNEAGYPYSFTSSELTTLKGMISSSQISENTKKKLKENYDDDEWNEEQETKSELDYDLKQFDKAIQQANGSYEATSSDGSLKVGDRVVFQTKLGLIDGIIKDFDINPMNGEETADIDYWNRAKAAKWTMLNVPLKRIKKL